MLRRVSVGLCALAGCHTVSDLETTRPGAARHVQRTEQATARPPALVVTDAGMLRFVEPLECPSEDVTRPETTVEHVIAPNFATFTVGVIATAIGGVLAARGVLGDSPGTSPYLYSGIGGLAVGIPLAVGPWIGTHSELRAGPAMPEVHTPGAPEPCGARPLAAKSATLSMPGIEVHGAIDADGVFSIAPFAWVDAYDPAHAVAVPVKAIVDSDTSTRTIVATLEPAELARVAPAWIKTADFTGAIGPFEKVSGLQAGVVRASLATTKDGYALRLVLPLENRGPGDAYGVRGMISAPAIPAIEGRIVYVGHLAKGASITRELLVPLTAAAAEALRGGSVDLAVELRDAYGTAPTTPAHFHGALLGDALR
ncbi:MAG TPA: hypothetical protein VGM88_10410 [Kofleriaceae bacterium]